MVNIVTESLSILLRLFHDRWDCIPSYEIDSYTYGD